MYIIIHLLTRLFISGTEQSERLVRNTFIICWLLLVIYLSKADFELNQLFAHAGWLVVCSGWLTGWMCLGWLTCRCAPVGCLVKVVRLVDWLKWSSWLTGWRTDWLGGWCAQVAWLVVVFGLVYWLMHSGLVTGWCAQVGCLVDVSLLVDVSRLLCSLWLPGWNAQVG